MGGWLRLKGTTVLCEEWRKERRKENRRGGGRKGDDGRTKMQVGDFDELVMQGDDNGHIDGVSSCVRCHSRR